MLNALAHELGVLTARRRQPGEAGEDTAALCNSSPLFARALQQLLAEGVEGCTKDLERALSCSVAGNSCYTAQDFHAAARQYSDGLRWLSCCAHPAQAARLHANRAQTLLKAAATSVGWQQQLATAAAEDCAAALAYCDAAFGVPATATGAPAVDVAALRRKVLDRQHAAHTLLQQQRQQQQQQQHTKRTAAAAAAAAAPAVLQGHANCSSTQQQQSAQHASPAQQAVAGTSSGLDALVWRAQQAAETYLRQQQQQQQQQTPGCVQQQPTAVSLRCCSDHGPRGRHLIAAGSIPPGTLLLAELPLAAVPLQQPGCRSSSESSSSSSSSTQPPLVCSWCLGAVPPHSLWPCEACPLVLYCSAACRQAGGGSSSSSSSSSSDSPAATSTAPAAAAAACHQHVPGGVECGKPWTKLLPPEALLASRCLSAAADVTDATAGLLASLVAHEEAAAEDAEQGQQVMMVQAALAELVAGIHAHHQHQQHGRQARSSSTAAPAAVQRCLHQLAVNAIAIRPLLAAGAADRQGLGLYPLTAALVNHSCSPNCSIRFAGRQLLLTCVAGAVAGEELTISYGPQAGQHTTQERQALLQLQYHFQCCCSACRQGLKQASSLVGLEAGLSGLACCSGGAAAACPGAVLVHEPLPAGILSVADFSTFPESLSAHRSSSTTSSSSSSRRVGCSLCGWHMPAEQLRAALQELEAAAAVAGEACRLTSVGRAAEQLHAVAETRQRHLASSNLLLGRSHHQAAAAQIEAAAAEAAAVCVQAQLQAVQDSLAMGTQQEVVLVLRQLRDSLDGLAAGADSSSSLPDLLRAAHAAVEEHSMRCCMGLGVQQQVEGMSLSGSAGAPAGSVQDHLNRAGQHLCSSAHVLSLVQPQDSLQVAAEVTACCAALLACISASAAEQPGERGSGCWRHGCPLAGLAAALHAHASAVFQLHLPEVCVPQVHK